ncbi:hypothetical protein XENOCAPTIV_014823, partial [Xenoophorus captivus]
VSHHGDILLGFDPEFLITKNTGSTILTVDTSWQDRWPSLFNGLGCLSAFDHQLLIDPAVSSVLQPLCWLPLALYDNVTAKILKLLDPGVIEWVVASSWISNLVVAKKKSGGLRRSQTC